MKSRAGPAKGTQSEVLRRFKELKHPHEAEESDPDMENLKFFRRATSYQALCEITDEILDSVVAKDKNLEKTIGELRISSCMLLKLENTLMNKAAAATRRRAETVALPKYLELEGVEPEMEFSDTASMDMEIDF